MHEIAALDFQVAHGGPEHQRTITVGFLIADLILEAKAFQNPRYRADDGRNHLSALIRAVRHRAVQHHVLGENAANGVESA